MGVGLLLRADRPKAGLFGRKPSAESWLKDVAGWSRFACRETLISAQTGHDGQGRPALALALHPLAEAVDIAVLPDGRVEVSARTSTTGAGYHVYVCELLDKLSLEFRLTWEPSDSDGDTGDETGYFVTRDGAAVEREMLAWLKGVAGDILQKIPKSEGTGWAIAIGFALGQPNYQHDGPLWTPLGPRDKSWLERVAADPLNGIDLFPWWQTGFGASYYLGRALSLMWTQVRWRPPITDEEEALLATVLYFLERAHKADPQLELPWPEWNELNGFAGRSDRQAKSVASRVDQQGVRPTIGYRRRPVRVSLPDGWSVEVPGSYAELHNPNGSWQGFDDRIVVYVGSISIQPKDANAPPPPAEGLLKIMPAGPDVLEYKGDGIVARSRFTNDKTLQGMSAVAGSLATCTITMESPDDRDLAIRIWRSIRHHGTTSDDPGS